MYNTIRLLHAYGEVKEEYGLIFEDGANPEEVMRWPSIKKEEALSELRKHRCSYKKVQGPVQPCVMAEEWALEYSCYDEDGEFQDGSDYDFAEAEPGFEFGHWDREEE